ncbi:ribonuclease P protein subunit p30 [Caerostris extrusa]|uniref:Ribonuclease P protein subunit p30 n=1 Tax=Caerostris extrusa TaxID=172846 RepID=A0AAV4MRK7_CAEEX|nr:ribonuclease P protein subunit p30 [Caerostris extrusa]
MDLNIQVEVSTAKSNHIKWVLQRACDFGYRTVAINTIVDSSKLSGKNISIPEPKLIDFKAEELKNFKVYNRITAIVEDSIHSHHFLKSPITKMYDIIAVQPVGEKMLQHVSSLSDIDIISLDLTKKLGYSLKRTTTRLAKEKGICFEICYSPCFRGALQFIVSNSYLLTDVLKGKNILLSSGTSLLSELRTVEDVMILGLLFGLNKNQAEESVKKSGELVLKHARTRNETGCGYVSLSGIINLPKHQSWVVQACKVPKFSESSSTNDNQHNVTKRKAIEISDDKDNKPCSSSNKQAVGDKDNKVKKKIVHEFNK